MQTADFSRPTPHKGADLGSSASTDRREAPRLPPGWRSRYTSINTPGWGGQGDGGGRAGGQTRAGCGCGRTRASPACIFPPPAPHVETHLPITSHSSYTSSNSTSSSAMVRRGQWPQRGGGSENRGGGAKSSVPGPWLLSLPSGPAGPRCRGHSRKRAGEGPGLRRLPQLATAPARAAGPGRRARAARASGAARPPLLLALLGPRCPACGSSGDRALLSLLRQPARAAGPRPFPLSGAGSGSAAGQLRTTGGRGRTVEGGSPRREVAAADRRWGPGRRRQRRSSSFSSSRRRCRPPAWGGRVFVGLALRAVGATAATFSSSSASAADQLTSPAHRPPAHALLPLRPRGFGTTGPAHSSPSGGGGPEESDQAERRMRAPRATSRQTGGRRESTRGGGLGPPGGICLGGGRAGSSPPRPSAEGSGTKDLHVLGSLRRGARRAGRSSFCNPAKPFGLLGRKLGKGPNEWESKNRGGEVLTPDRARRGMILVPLSFLNKNEGCGRSVVHLREGPNKNCPGTCNSKW